MRERAEDLAIVGIVVLVEAIAVIGFVCMAMVWIAVGSGQI